MANFITSASFVTITGTSASSTATGYAASNAALYTHPNRTWRATGTAGASVTVSFGSIAVKAVIVDNVNATGITITTNAGAEAVTVARDAADGRRKAYHTPADTTTATTSVVVAYASGADAAYFEVGSIAVLSAVTTWTINAEFPYEVTPLWPSIANDNFTGGGREPVLVGNRYCRISLTQSNYPVTSGATNVWNEINTIASYGQHQPLVFYRNASSTAEVYVCRRIGDCTMSLNGPGHFGVRGLMLEECV